MEEKRLSEFLKENDVYESFIENCLNDGDTLQYIKDCSLSNIGISNGFTWVDTPQGFIYWENLMDKSFKLNITNDMDEILYREYEKRNMKESFEQTPITKDIVENDEVENIKQEFQTITLNGVDYYLIPRSESPLLTLNDLRDIGLSEKDLLGNGYSEEDLRKEPYEEHLKRKFEGSKDNYEVLFKEKKSKDWSFCYRPKDLSWRKDWDYKLIKKEHKEIFESYLKDNTLKIKCRWFEGDWMLLDDFIEKYDEDMQLKVIKKEFEPFTLNIEINTIDEVKSLWNRFNLNYISLCEAMQSKYYRVESQNIINDIGYWKQLDNVLKNLGEKPDVKP